MEFYIRWTTDLGISSIDISSDLMFVIFFVIILMVFVRGIRKS